MFSRKSCLVLVTVALSSFIAQAAPACSNNTAGHAINVADRAAKPRSRTHSGSHNGQSGFGSNNSTGTQGGSNNRTSGTSGAGNNTTIANSTATTGNSNAGGKSSNTTSSTTTGNSNASGKSSNTTSTTTSGNGNTGGQSSNTTSTTTSGNGNTGGNGSNTTSTSASSSNNTSTAANGNGNPQTSLTLDPKVICTGFENNGQSVPTPGQVASLTSNDNFINFCLTSNLPLTNGLQVAGGSCNPAPMGLIPSVNNMPSAKFVFPKNFGTIQANTDFTVQMAIQNMETGHFVNAQQNYFAAPQQLNAQGQIQGHSHVVIEQLSAIDQTTPTNPQRFAFFKGLNNAAQNGVLTAAVVGGLPVGIYKVSSINTAANHQPVLVPIAQHGSLDDVVYFTVTANGNPASGSAGSSSSSNSSASSANNSTSTAGSSSSSNSTSVSSANNSTSTIISPPASANATKSVAAAGATNTGKNSGTGKTSGGKGSGSSSTNNNKNGRTGNRTQTA